MNDDDYIKPSERKTFLITTMTKHGLGVITSDDELRASHDVADDIARELAAVLRQVDFLYAKTGKESVEKFEQWRHGMVAPTLARYDKVMGS